jgi:hypothetical protein
LLVSSRKRETADRGLLERDRDLHEAVNYTRRDDYAAEPNMDWGHSSRLLCPLMDTMVHESEGELGD